MSEHQCVHEANETCHCAGGPWISVAEMLAQEQERKRMPTVRIRVSFTMDCRIGTKTREQVVEEIRRGWFDALPGEVRVDVLDGCPTHPEWMGPSSSCPGIHV